MLKEKIKKNLDNHQNLKQKIRNSDLYIFIRDMIFLHEQKKEKRIERKYGLEGAINYCKKWYKSSSGHDLDLNNPKTITEKQQWLKFYDNNDLKPICSDKYRVREFIRSKIGDEYLVPLISIDGKELFSNANQIDFNKLPNQFVLSCNHGSSMTIVVKDKSKLSSHKIKSIKRKINRWLKIDLTYINAFDYTYKGIVPGVIITKYLADETGDLKDYKFMCFNGECKFMWIDSDRFINHKRTTFDMNFNKLPFRWGNYQESIINEKPNCFNKMKDIANQIAKSFKMIRVDFYYVNNKLYIGELTLNSGAGIEFPHPDEYNEIIGNKLNIKD